MPLTHKQNLFQRSPKSYNRFNTKVRSVNVVDYYLFHIQDLTISATSDALTKGNHTLIIDHHFENQKLLWFYKQTRVYTIQRNV